jgi:RNA polymerase-binding protein DksA
MTRNELEAYRQKLLALSHHFDQELDQRKHEAFVGTGQENTADPRDQAQDVGDRSIRETEETLALALAGQGEQIAGEVVDALERIEAGTFGLCEECGRAIPTQRLNAVPYARYCMECASEMEPKP